jgi:hypothetical protein
MITANAYGVCTRQWLATDPDMRVAWRGAVRCYGSQHDHGERLRPVHQAVIGHRPDMRWRGVVVGDGEQRRWRRAAAVAVSSGGWRAAAVAASSGGSAALPPLPDSPSRISMTCATTPAETLQDPVTPTRL